MKVPSLKEAEMILNRAQQRNPGQWVDHNRVTAFCARQIAEKISGLDPDAAYVLGLLHDIGREDGNADMRHLIDGYNAMMAQGYDDNARICLTHTFPSHKFGSYDGINDCTEAETAFMGSTLNALEFDDYDRLIQLCDALAFHNGPTILEKRLVDATLRNGFNDYTLEKWQAFIDLKAYFDDKAGYDIYELILVNQRVFLNQTDLF
jgi:hypothetical protein